MTGFITCRDPRLRSLKVLLILAIIMMIGLPAEAAPKGCVSPPTLVNPLTFIDKCPEDPGGPLQVIARERDVLIELPTNRTCAKRLSVVRARNLRITGGHWVFNDTQSSVISIGSTSGITFIDGAHIDVNRRSADAIRTYRHKGRLIVQNVHIEGVSGTDGGTHGDVIHAQGGGPLRELVLQNVSGYTGYQGLFAPYRVSTGHGTRKLRLIRVNIAYEPWLASNKPLKLFFIGDANNPNNLTPDRGTVLKWVHADGTPQSFRYDWTVYTTPDRDGTGCATFAPEHLINGTVCGGPPPGGDYAPASLVGLNYQRGAFCR